jgi:hypothetical protein
MLWLHNAFYNKDVSIWFRIGERSQIMGLAIPMGQRNHSKEVVEMVKRHEKKYA